MFSARRMFVMAVLALLAVGVACSAEYPLYNKYCYPSPRIPLIEPDPNIPVSWVNEKANYGNPADGPIGNPNVMLPYDRYAEIKQEKGQAEADAFFAAAEANRIRLTTLAGRVRWLNRSSYTAGAARGMV